MAGKGRATRPHRITDPHHPPDGYLSRRTVNGHRVITIDWWVVPARNRDNWYEKTLKVMGKRRFDREFARDWSNTEGRPFYPEADDWGAALVQQSPGALLDLPVIRGWDFGFQHPACVWLQYSPQQHQVWVLNEFMPENIDTYTFRDLVLYLSGQTEKLELSSLAQRWVQRIEQDGRYPKTPWYTPRMGRQWVDYSGPEATKRTASVQGENAARQDLHILAEKGIYLTHPFVTIKARETVMRSLLRPRSDNPELPHIFFDPACPLLIEGMQGHIVYDKPTEKNPTPDEPMKDGLYEHLHDAMGYALVNAVPVVAAKGKVESVQPNEDGRLQLPRASIPTRHERREAEEQQEDLDYQETRQPGQATWSRRS